MISYNQTLDTEIAVASLTEAKAQLRVTHSNEDTVIQGYVDTAIIMAQDYLGRSIHQYNVVLTTTTFSDAMRLEKTPVLGDVTVQYYDVNDSLQPLATSAYSIKIIDSEPIMYFTNVSTLPTLYDRIDAVKITYNVGYEDATKVPKPIKQYVLLKTTQLYENRNDTVQRYSTFSESLLRPYRKWQY